MHSLPYGPFAKLGYKPKVNQPQAVFAKKLVLKTGIDIKPGTRLEYVYVKAEDRMATPEEAEKIDYP